ncbi:MAG: CPBP family intramembrane metalloprotease [Candidatus Korarchaeota archaeon]|nr:CPBP family intramembrane metalloprotease [Candidatus Korarchaeota archaeon]
MVANANLRHDLKALAYMILQILLITLLPSTYLRAAFSLLVFLTVMFIERRDLGLGGWQYALKGALIAFLLVLPFLAIASISEGSISSIEELLSPFIYHLSVSIWEENVFRAYPLYRLTVGSLLSSSLLFSLVHAYNPGFGIMPFLGIFTAGIMLGLMRYEFGLGAVYSFHLAWNFLIGHILGLTLSGISGGPSLLRSYLEGPEILTGGVFGPEGSVIAIGEFTLLSILLFKQIASSR